MTIKKLIALTVIVTSVFMLYSHPIMASSSTNPDFNDDGCIDREDYTLLMSNIRSRNPYDVKYDLNEDNMVNRADARVMVSLFTNPRGAKCPIPLKVAIPSLERIASDPTDGSLYVKDEVLIGVSRDIEVSEILSIVDTEGGKIIGSSIGVAVIQVQFDTITDSVSLDAKIAQLMSYDIIEIAGRSMLVDTRKVPDIGKDPEWARFEPEDTWNEMNPRLENASLEFIKMPSAWDFTTGNSTVRIAIIDEGFDTSHEDLISQIVLDGGVLTRKPTMHGTLVAGIVGATGNSIHGITGMLWDTQLMLFGVRAFPLSAASWLSQIDAAEDAIDSGAKIINLSSGNTSNVSFQNWAWKSLINWKGKDTLFVFATGNEVGDDAMSTPSSLAADPELDNVISVTAIEFDWGDASTNRLKGFGGSVSVAAPGQAYSTSYIEELVNSYGSDFGTSFATPYVSGLAGLLWSIDETLTPAQVKDFIIRGAEQDESGRKVPGESFYVIDAAESLRLLSPPPSETTLFQDDFNRPNSSEIGNGWTKLVGGSDIELVDGAVRVNVVSSENLPLSGIFRFVDYVGDVTLKGTIYETNGFRGLSRRYMASIGVLGDGSPSSGYHIRFARSDINFNNSQVILFDNGVIVQTIFSTFQFGSEIAVEVTFREDGVVSGTVSGDSQQFDFDFPHRTVESNGEYIYFEADRPDTRRTSSYRFHGLDDFSVIGESRLIPN
jgi:subtilisin family serine protease